MKNLDNNIEVQFVYIGQGQPFLKKGNKSLGQPTKGLDFISDKEICTRYKVYQPKS